jgi:hypothetical protein
MQSLSAHYRRRCPFRAPIPLAEIMFPRLRPRVRLRPQPKAKQSSLEGAKLQTSTTATLPRVSDTRMSDFRGGRTILFLLGRVV